MTRNFIELVFVLRADTQHRKGVGFYLRASGILDPHMREALLFTLFGNLLHIFEYRFQHNLGLSGVAMHPLMCFFALIPGETHGGMSTLRRSLPLTHTDVLTDYQYHFHKSQTFLNTSLFS